MYKIKLSTQNEPLEADYSDVTSVKTAIIRQLSRYSILFK